MEYGTIEVGINWVVWIIGVLGASVFIALFPTMIVITRQKTAKVVELLGKFSGVKQVGLNLKMPWPLGKVVGIVSLKIRELKENIGVKTRDNAFLTVPVKVQFQTISTKVKRFKKSLKKS